MRGSYPQRLASPHEVALHLNDQGNVLVVWKLDHLSHSLKDVLTLIEKIQQAAAGF